MRNKRRRKQELETLSAYLDGELRPTQRQAIEARLQHEPGLQDQLENLRKTKIMVGYLPHLRAPHNYTLTPEMVTVRRRKKPPILGTLRLASALAAILLVVLFGAEFLLTSGPLARPQLGAKPMLEEYYAMEAATVEEEPEPLILWAEPDREAEEFLNGMGGDIEVMEEQVMVESLPTEPEVGVEEEILPEDEPELMLEAEALPPAEEDVDTLQIDPVDEEERPILGINPEESGEIIGRYSDTLTEKTALPTWRLVVRVLQITMGTILVGGGLAWWLLRRHALS